MATAKTKPAVKKAPAKKAPAKPAAKTTKAVTKAPAKKAVAKTPVKRAVKEPAEPKAPAKKKFSPTMNAVASLDAIARKFDLDDGSMQNVPPLSTGILAFDIVWGGGIRPGWYTNAGGEQSAKTTTALNIMSALIKTVTKNQDSDTIAALWDYEGSTGNSRPYVESIMRTAGVNKSADQIFGKRDSKTGKWLNAPIVRYHESSVGEDFFDWLDALLKDLPNKRFVGGKWWYVYTKNKVNLAKYSEYYDAHMSKTYGNGIYIPAEDGSLQAVVLLDSLPAMNPRQNDENANAGLAKAARMFSEQLPRIKGRMSKKRVAVIAINQLRSVPMAMYGPPEQEPCGQAVRFYSDVRVWHASIKSGAPFNPKFDGQFEYEKNIHGGRDKYRYVRLQAKKNKLSEPQRESWVRIWVKDGKGEARGLDPFFDTMNYLKSTGQLTGGKSRKNFYLNLEGVKEFKKPFDWMTLKTWVNGTREEVIALCKKLGLEKPISLRQECFKQMKNGTGESLYLAVNGSAGEDPDDVDDGDDDDAEE